MVFHHFENEKGDKKLNNLSKDNNDRNCCSAQSLRFIILLANTCSVCLANFSIVCDQRRGETIDLASSQRKDLLAKYAISNSCHFLKNG